MISSDTEEEVPELTDINKLCEKSTAKLEEKPEIKSKQAQCKFWPKCSKVDCVYFHPDKECTYLNNFKDFFQNVDMEMIADMVIRCVDLTQDV